MAIQFLTRIPVPATARLDADTAQSALSKSIGWFPLVGALIGTITAGAILLSGLFWPRIVAVLIGLIVEARLTGAFHEDAVADFCDAFGGGWDAEAVRRIMKDSRIGSYGALGLGLAVTLRAALLIVLPASLIAPALIASATFGRLMPVVVMALVAPAPAGTGIAKDIAADVGLRTVLLAILTALPGLACFAVRMPMAMAMTTAAAGAFLWWFRSLLIRRIGGCTGDCLGFAAYAGQIGLLLAATAS
jgi:adenosylcobinamide-GDP ribazoletransferase